MGCLFLIAMFLVAYALAGPTGIVIALLILILVEMSEQ